MDYATDFTSRFSKPSQQRSLFGTSGHCGFCNETSACACRDSTVAQRVDEPPAVHPSTTTMPGSCDKCLNDPEQAKRCRDLAQYSRFNMPSDELSEATVTAPPTTAQKAKDRVSCTSFFEQFVPGRDNRPYQAAFRHLHPVPYQHARFSGQHAPAMELSLIHISEPTRPY